MRESEPEELENDKVNEAWDEVVKAIVEQYE